MIIPCGHFSRSLTENIWNKNNVLDTEELIGPQSPIQAIKMAPKWMKHLWNKGNAWTKAELDMIIEHIENNDLRATKMPCGLRHHA